MLFYKYGRIENIGKRIRYYQSMIDMDSLVKGADYSQLKDFLSFIKSNRAESDFTKEIANWYRQRNLNSRRV